MAPTIRSVADIVRALQRAKTTLENRSWGGVTFLVGAGCSKSAGIPLGEEIARECAIELATSYSNDTFRAATSDEAIAWLRQNGHVAQGGSWSAVYGELFERHYTDPSEQRRIVQAATGKAQGINWAHVCLGELARQHYVHTILTTNFDQLVLDGMVRTGLIPVVADGVESLNRIDGAPNHPQVVHLHGSRHTYNPRNSRWDVTGTAALDGVVRTLGELLRSSQAFVIVGYAGGEEGVMDVLIRAARDLREKTIYWVQYSPHPDALAPRAVTLLEFSRAGGLVVDQDADTFFAQLMRGLAIGLPRWMKEPVVALQDLAGQIIKPNYSEVSQQLDLHADRLRVLSEALAGWENARSTATRLLDESRGLLLAGRPSEVVALLGPKISQMDTPEHWTILGDAHFELGEPDRDSQHLQSAVDAYRAAEAALARIRSARPNDRARLQDKLGSALQLLGTSDSGTARLKEAIQAHKAALQVFTREDAPSDWAMITVNLGTALQELGQREGGTTHLEEAVEAHRAVLDVQTLDRSPLEWARTSNNLANALQSLGRREERTSRLSEAISVYREVFKIYTRTQTPLPWATIQNNLGTALRALGEREGNVSFLEEAVVAFRAALEVYTRTLRPLDWAMTQNNLGNTLYALGKLDTETARLEEAVKAYREALEVRTRARPRLWAMTQTNLGNALCLLGERKGDSTLLEAAVDTHRAALDTRKVDGGTHEWAVNQLGLAEALSALGLRENSATRLEDAVRAYRAALEVFSHDHMHPERKSAEDGLAATLRALEGHVSSTPPPDVDRAS